MNNLSKNSSFSKALCSSHLIYAFVVVGLLIRLVILFTAENQLDADEATVGIMALDILEGKSFPFFFYGNTYNGGGAFEAYLCAIGFAIFGPSMITVKFCILLIWTISALFFANLCQRIMPEKRAYMAMLFFAIGSPFFLEWSMKARGGYSETVLFTILLLWISHPPRFLKDNIRLQSLSFGIIAGIGLWTSEMLLAMIPCAAGWLLINRLPGERRRAVYILIAGGIIGLLPLVYYNLTHQWLHFKQSILFSFLNLNRDVSVPLSFPQMVTSVRFVFGNAWIPLIIGLIVSVYRILSDPKRWRLSHIILIHMIIYIAAYWFAGLRFLSIPPSRILYAIYPGIAILLANLIEVRNHTKFIYRWTIIGIIVIWIIPTSISITNWIATGKPRETGSWRSTWSLIDGAGLYQYLIDEDVEIVYVNYWTAQSLYFANRGITHKEKDARQLAVFWKWPQKRVDPEKKAAIVLNSQASAFQQVMNVITSKGIIYQRSQWRHLAVIYVSDSSKLYQEPKFPIFFAANDWEARPLISDGFN